MRIANRLLFLAPVGKYFIHSMKKKGQSDLTDPQARQRMWSYREDPAFGAHELLKLNRWVRRRLSQVTCPLLVIHSTLDRAICPDSASYTYQRVGSADKDLVTLHNSGHGLTVDSEWEWVAERTYLFITNHLS